MPRHTVHEHRPDEPLIVSARADPQASSWWAGCSDAEFTARSHREAHRMTTEKLPAKLEQGLNRMDAERRLGRQET